MREEISGSLHGIKISRRSPSVSHLLFADDVMVFARANANEAYTILKCLSIYSAWSGQSINPFKSSIFFSRNCRLASKVAVNNILHLALPRLGLNILVFLSFLIEVRKTRFQP